MVTPGTSSGKPAASQQVRAMSPACGPSASVQPKMTSSTAAGSTSARPTSSFRTWAPRSAEWTLASPPFFLPTGVLTASTMYASAMCGSPLHDHGRAVSEQPLVDAQAYLGVLDLTALRLPPELPGQLADLRDGLRRNGFTEARQPAARVHRDPPAEGRVAVADQPL